MDLIEQLKRDLTEELERDEGERLKVYLDTKGNPTIGTGHLMDESGRRVAEAVIGHRIGDDGITQTENDAILAYDIDCKTEQVFGVMPWARLLDEPHQGALVNLCFNMGVHTLSTFNVFLGLFRERKFEQAAADLHSTLWASEVGNKIDPPGRATRICRQIETGQWV